MDALLHIGLSNALVAALLALVALAVGSLGRRPALAHALWLLVLLKLITPPLVWVPVPWPAPVETAAAGTEPAPAVADLPPIVLELPPAAEPEPGPDAGPAGEVAALPELPAGTAEAPAPTPAPPADAAGASWSALVGVVWLAGSAAWFGLAGLRLCRFRRLLWHARPAPPELQEQARQLAGRLGLRRCPGVWLLPGRLAPMLWAAGCRPRVLVPAGLLEQVGERGLETLLLHELAHLRRRDHWVRGLEFLALGLYWWHPFVWLARRELREAEEQCCDAWVVAALPGSGRAYATALVDALDFLSAARAAVPPLASGLGQISDLKRRLTMIMRGTTPRSLGWPGGLAVLTLAALLLPLLPAWSGAQQPPPPPQPGEKPDPNADRKEGLYGIRLQVEPRPVNEDVRGVRLRTVYEEADGPELEKARAELAKIEADLRQKMAEVERARLRLRLAAERARLQAQNAGPTKARVLRVAANAHIEVIGLDDKPEVRGRVIEALTKILPRDRRVIILCGGGMGLTGNVAPGQQRFLIEMRSAPLNPLKVVPPLPKNALPPVALPAGPNKPMQAAPDRRFQDLRQKLDMMQRDLEKLRHELRREGPAAAPVRPRQQGQPDASNQERVKDLEDQLARARAEYEVAQVRVVAAREASDQAIKSRQTAATAAVRAAEAQLRMAKSDVEMAAERRDWARRMLDRKVITKAQADTNEAKFQSKMAALEQAQASLVAAREKMDALKAGKDGESGKAKAAFRLAVAELEKARVEVQIVEKRLTNLQDRLKREPNRQ